MASMKREKFSIPIVVIANGTSGERRNYKASMRMAIIEAFASLKRATKPLFEENIATSQMTVFAYGAHSAFALAASSRGYHKANKMTCKMRNLWR